MLALRPEMAKDGFKVGDKVKGKILHARYSHYMQRPAQMQTGRFTGQTWQPLYAPHLGAPTGTISLSLANNASNGIEPSFSHHYFCNVIREARPKKDGCLLYELLAYRHYINAHAMPVR